MDDNKSSSSPNGKRKRDANNEEDDLRTQATAEPSELLNLDDEDDGSDSENDDDSENISDGEDNESIAGECEYEESSEALPRCAAFDKDFAQVGRDLASIPSKVVQIINKNGCDSRRAQSCRNNANDLANIPRARREKIALLGNTGAGKSSLLNSLLGMPKLAKSASLMAAGQSCTHVGTEYECPFPGQTKKLAAKVEYFDISEIEVLLERLLKDYNTWYCDRPEEMEEDEEQELKRLGITAFDTLRALFCDKSEMISPGVGHDYLDAAYRNGTPDVFATFSEWCSDLLEEKESDEADKIEYLDADNQRKLLEQLEPLVFSTSRPNQPSLWPLVKKVRIGIAGPSVLEHVVLVDLPGLDDTNKVRVDASLDMLRSCDWIWVVTKIDRAITDTTVDSLLSRYGRSYSIIVICTGIDDNIDPGLASFLHAEGQSVGDYEALRTREKELTKALKKASKLIATRRAKLEGRNKVKIESKRRLPTDAAKVKLRAQIQELEAQVDSMEIELPKVATERYVTLVDARNAFTVRRLKEEKVEYTPAGKELEVFCVSNVHYSALKGARQINGPRLDAEMTGIPALRSYIMESAAPRILASVENYIEHRFTVFMKGLAMWAKSYSIEGSDELLRSIEEPQERTVDIMESYLDDLKEAIDTLITEPVTEDLEDIAEKAAGVVDGKRKWNYGTVRAFVRRDGCHRTSVAPQQNWNEQFLEGANQITRDQWDQVIEKQEELGGELRGRLEDLVKGIEKTVGEHPAYLLLPTDRLQDTFAAQLRGVEQACIEHQNGLKKELRNINLDLSQDRHSGYFTQAMSEAYEKSKSYTGKGTKARILSTFETHLSLQGARSPFSVMCDKLTAAVAAEAKAKNKVLAQQTQDILQEIHRQFSEIVDEKIDDAGERELRTAFVGFLRKAEPKLEDVKADLRRIKRRYGL